MPDGSNFFLQMPRPGEPELATLAGMAAPQPGEAVQALGAVTPLAMPDTSGPGPVALQKPPSWAYDFDPTSGNSRATYIGVVFTGGTAAGNQVATKADIAAATSGVSSFNTRTGAVVLTLADVTSAGGAPQTSPTFAGVPNAPTAAPGTNSTQLATTMFVTQAVTAAAGVASFNGRLGAVTLTLGDVTSVGGAPIASPTLSGTPTTPTMTGGDASPAIASTQFVANAIAAGTVISWNGRRGAVAMTLGDVTSVGGAPIASPTFTGTPSVPTAAPGTATVQAASTAFVTNAVTAAAAGVASFNTRTGAVTLLPADLTAAGGAPINSPAITGTPTAPTATAGTSTTQIATTAFVANAIVGLPGVASFNGRQGAVTLQLADVTSVGGAPLASPSLSGSPNTTTPSPGDNSTRIASTAFVNAAVGNPVSSFNTRTGAVSLTAGDVAGVGGQLNLANLVDNSGFSIDQRVYASGTALAAGIYGHDRWKAGAGGCTYTFTQSSGPTTTITITAGTLQQVIEGAALAGGNYMLSWTGTAQGRVGAGTYAASPVALAGVAAGTNATIEFNAGTLGTVKLEAGTTATQWRPNLPSTELADCQRFFQVGSLYMIASNQAAGGVFGYQPSFVATMRAAPTTAFFSPSYNNASGLTSAGASQSAIAVFATAIALGVAQFSATFTASADL